MGDISVSCVVQYKSVWLRLGENLQFHFGSPVFAAHMFSILLVVSVTSSYLRMNLWAVDSGEFGIDGDCV